MLCHCLPSKTRDNTWFKSYMRSIHSQYILALPTWLAIIFVLSVRGGVHCAGQGGLSFTDILPENSKMYDKMKPPKKDGKPTKVFFHVTVMGLDSINEGSMTYAADIFFAQTWKDHRLRLPENMTSEYRLLEVQWLQNMWRPDSYFKNAKAVTFQTMTIPNHYVWLYHNKDILYMVKLTLTLSCAMNFASYPHDTQTCSLQMESLSYTIDDLVFDWEKNVPLAVDDNIELPQLDLVKTERGDCTQVYSTGNFTCLQVIFTLKRRLGYYLFHTYIPTCLIVIMSWVSFWIKPEAVPARVTLGVTSLLTLSTQHAKSQASLPPVSYIKAIDIFMSSCTVFVFLSLMEYAVVNVVLEEEESTSKKINNSSFMGKRKVTSQSSLTGDKRRKATENMKPSTSADPDDLLQGRQQWKRYTAAQDNMRIFNLQPKLPGLSPAQKRRRRAIMIDRASRVFFPLSFVILNISYWVYYVGLL